MTLIVRGTVRNTWEKTSGDNVYPKASIEGMQVALPQYGPQVRAGQLVELDVAVQQRQNGENRFQVVEVQRVVILADVEGPSPAASGAGE